MASPEILNLTQREQARLEIADQVENFLRHGGCIEVLSGPGAFENNPIGRVWWEAGGNVRGGGSIVGNSF